MTAVVTRRKFSLASLALVLGTMLWNAPTPARANELDVAAKLLASRAWYEDLGSFGGQYFGRVLIFNMKATYKAGWYSGTIVRLQGKFTVPVPINWKMTAQGVLIDNITSVELATFVGHQPEALIVTGGGLGARPWLSTRHPNTPLPIRLNYTR